MTNLIERVVPNNVLGSLENKVITLVGPTGESACGVLNARDLDTSASYINTLLGKVELMYFYEDPTIGYWTRYDSKSKPISELGLAHPLDHDNLAPYVVDLTLKLKAVVAPHVGLLKELTSSQRELEIGEIIASFTDVLDSELELQLNLTATNTESDTTTDSEVVPAEMASMEAQLAPHQPWYDEIEGTRGHTTVYNVAETIDGASVITSLTI